MLSFFQPTYCRVPRQRKTVPRARLCHFPNFGYNHGWDGYKLGEETGRILYSRDVTWNDPEAPWITLVRATPTEAPRDISAPGPKYMPAAASSPAPSHLHQFPRPHHQRSNQPRRQCLRFHQRYQQRYSLQSVNPLIRYQQASGAS